MDKIRYGEWACRTTLSLFLLVVNVVSQPGFLSLNCGGKTNITARNGITWISDANYIDVGQTADIKDVTKRAYGSYLHSIRVFPKPLNKSCYQLPVVPDVPHLLRLWFTLGNYGGFDQWPSFAFSFETPGLLVVYNTSFTDINIDIYYYEYVLVSSGSVLYICLIRTSDTNDPFINAIELRTLRKGMYGAAKPGTMLSFSRRRNVGGHSNVIRFIENNNFSGVIPAQLFKELLNNSLKLNYSGNPYLFKPSPISKSKLGVVLGVTLSGILIIALASIVGTVFYRKIFRRKEGDPISIVGANPVVDPDYSMVMVPNPTKSRAFTLDEMMVATQNFSKKIGRGGFGWVFFGQLPEEKDIAVKVLSLSSRQGVNEFLNEVDLLSRIHHRNLVALLGYCNESREPMLVYEYMSKGCFRDHLYGDSARLSQLNWRMRVKIALDAAQGLEYLHVGCTPKIIHRDVKTANILLDENFNGKLADFGLSRMTVDEEATHVTTVVKGTPGYLDPEYFTTHTLTEKSDVYSFGVVLLEIICGRQPIDVNLPEEEVNLIQWVTTNVKMDEDPRKMSKIIDKGLGDDYDMKSIIRVAKLAIRCVHAKPSYRPRVTEVVGELREAAKHDNNDSEDNGIECLDLEARPTYLRVESNG